MQSAKLDANLLADAIFAAHQQNLCPASFAREGATTMPPTTQFAFRTFVPVSGVGHRLGLRIWENSKFNVIYFDKKPL